MMTADRVIRWSTALAVLGVAAVAAVASFEHAYDLVRAHGESGWTARMVPLTVDGLIYASSMVMLASARRKVAVPARARWLRGLGIATTLAADVTHGLGARPDRCRLGRVTSRPADRLLRTSHHSTGCGHRRSGPITPAPRPGMLCQLSRPSCSGGGDCRAVPADDKSARYRRIRFGRVTRG
jgi:hypothetical protein